MDVETLLKALDNESNSHLLELTHKKIHDMKCDILGELSLSKKEVETYLSKLKDYRFVDSMNEIKYGSFIRWIPIVDPKHIFLTTGAIFCEFKVKKDGVAFVYKNFKNRQAQGNWDECLMFQKMTTQEHVLLSALDHLAT